MRLLHPSSIRSFHRPSAGRLLLAFKLQPICIGVGRCGAGSELHSDATPDQLVVNEKKYDCAEHSHQQTVQIEPRHA